MKKIINTNKAPEPIGPYNQAILANGTLYLSGQIAIDPITNNLVIDNIENETIQVLENLKSVLSKAKMSLKNVVKTTIYVKDMNNFNIINKVYGSYFDNENAPARETIEVSKLPKNVNVEISMIAVE